MDSKTKWLIGGFVYLLGALGTFLITFMEVRKTAWSDVDMFEEAFIAALIWPYELIKLIMDLL